MQQLRAFQIWTYRSMDVDTVPQKRAVSDDRDHEFWCACVCADFDKAHEMEKAFGRYESFKTR